MTAIDTNVLNHIKESPRINAKDCAREMNMNSVTCWRKIQVLLECHLIQYVGRFGFTITPDGESYLDSCLKA